MTASVSAPVALGRFSWMELMTPDTTAAINFYTKVVGWTTTPWEGEIPYTMWTTPTGMVGGLMALGAEMKARGVPPHWLAYVTTPDTDATLQQVKELGGQVKMPGTDIPKVGRFGVFSDPQGAVIAAFTPLPNDMPRYDGPPRVQEWCWHELGTTDQRAAFDFYHKIFGWEKTDSMEMGPGQVYQMYGIGGQSLGGMSNLDPKANRPPAWLHYIEIADVDRAATESPRLGGTVLTGPMDVPQGRMLVMIDPQGAAVGLHTGNKR